MNVVRVVPVIALGLVAACGDRPTLTLRYAPPVGAAHRYGLEQEVTMKMEGDSFPAGTQQTLGIRIGFTQTVHGPVEGGTEVRLRVDSVALSSPQIPREAMAQAGAILHGLVTAIVFDARMLAVRSSVADPGGASPRDAAMISSSLRGASLPLPDGPVRVGEEWTVKVPAPTGQLPGMSEPVMLTSRLRIKSFDVEGTDTVVRITFETSFPKDPIPIAFESPGATLQIKGGLSGEQVYSTGRQALVSSSMSGTVRTTTKGGGVGDNVVTIEQRLDLRLRPPLPAAPTTPPAKP